MAIGIILSIFGGLIAIFIAMIVIFVMWDKTFKNRVFIARQTGKGFDDVIWVVDRCKVIKHKGNFLVVFRNFRMKTLSPEGEYWTKVGSKKAARFTQEQWETRDMRRLVQRGLFLYETSEGMMYPMRINDSGTGFNVMNQDTRMFLANSIIEDNELTKRALSEIIAQIAIIAGIVIMIVGFIVGYIYINKTGQENIALSAQVCSDYAKAVFNVTQTGQPTFVNNIPIPGG